MTPDVGKRAPFELLAFTAAPVAGGLIVVKLEGRFTPQNGRFTRHPVLVVESSDDRPRLELAPIRARRDDGRWRGVYAIPAEAMPDARLALGVRGTLLELPAPDEPDDTDRLSVLAREANNLRRALEAAEAAAVTARAESIDRIATLETELAEARARADAAEQRVTEADARAAEAEVRAASVEVRATDADTRASHAEARVSAAEKAARAAEAGTEVLRAELAEERERAPTRTAEAPRGPIAPAPVHTARATQPRSPTHWIAVGALALFAFLLLGLLAGFLG
ncbi:MAG: hypothetical protein ABW167_13955 [Baekduia sp.]